MIDLYTFATPNGRKISIMLEEIGFEYTTHIIDIRKDEQFKKDFLRISPNNKIPAIIDHDGPEGKSLTLFESGAILWYLAEKAGKLMPEGARGRYEVMQWLMFQMGGIGPMLGQNHHFRLYAPAKIEYAVDRYTAEAKRLYGVLDQRLSCVEYVAGNYSIADIALYPWLALYERQGIELSDFPCVERWLSAVAGRPAVIRGIAVPE